MAAFFRRHSKKVAKVRNSSQRFLFKQWKENVQTMRPPIIQQSAFIGLIEPITQLIHRRKNINVSLAKTPPLCDISYGMVLSGM